MKKLTYKLMFVLLFIPFTIEAQLPTVDISTTDIRSVLGLTGETTFQAMCTASNVNSAGLNNTYCPGSDAAARLTNLRSTPYDIGKFRGYDHNAITCTLSLDFQQIDFCETTTYIEVTVLASKAWTLTKISGGNAVTASKLSGTGTDIVAFSYNGIGIGDQEWKFTSDGCSDVYLSITYTSSPC